MEGTEASSAGIPHFITFIVAVAQYPGLPPEILSGIFLRAIAPEFLLDSSLTAGPDSPWWKAMETALSVSTVCQSWHLPGIRLLYENVVFRNLRQLPFFLRTIETNPLTYQNLVKHITIYAFVYPHYGASFSRYLQNIINSCPSLKRFSFLSPVELPCTAVIPTLNSGITHLCLRTATPTILFLLDCVRDSLISLTITVHHAPLEIINTDKTFLLPNLQDLSIYVEDKEPLNRILDLLLVPRLQRFIFSSVFDTDDSLASLTSFLETYGRRVTLLHLWSVPLRAPCMGLWKLLQVCPVLEHIALYPGFYTSVTHSNVRWMDIGPMPRGRAGGGDDVMWTLSKAKAAFPKLKGFREVFSPEFIKPISIVLPPDLVVSDDEAFDFTFPGIELQYRPGVVRILRFIDDFDYQDFTYDSDCEPDLSSSEESEDTGSVSVGSLEDLFE
ncbi:hypothetical protein C0995_010813 [Termitomyces sp. Mi166|nr:hypothetical protein C0995_010813 [Termitomyces sp. Mi166\